VNLKKILKNRDSYTIFGFNRAVTYIALFFIMFSNPLFSKILIDIDQKCIWVNRESIIDTARIDTIISFAEKNNIDKIFLQIRGRGDALYESQIVPRYEALDSLFDPLNYVIERTRENSIEVHAWFNTYILWSNSMPPKDLSHFYYTCPECLATDLNGKNDKDIKLNQNHSLAWEGIYLAPTHPNVNSYLLSVIDELLKTYQLDGIHLDYIRYQDIFYGYNSEGINNFEDIYQFNPKDINRGLISTRFGYTEAEVDSLTNLWDSYKLDNITQFVRSIKYLIINDGLNVELSAAVKPNIIESKYRWSQDWISWIKEDIVDFVVIMNYEENINKFNLNNTLITNRLSNNELSKVYVGVSTYNQSVQDASDKILLSRLNGFENFSIFNYDLQKDTTNWYQPMMKLLNFNID
tara:strand:+ start:571 stop:1794 length:1224 start_codon:yes stop_codon:yes gene_type:complete